MGKAKKATRKREVFLVSPHGAPEVTLGPAQGRGGLYTPRIQFLPFAGADKFGKERGQILLTTDLWNKWFAEKGAILWDECDTFDKLVGWLIEKGYRYGCPLCNAEFTDPREQKAHLKSHRKALEIADEAEEL